MSVNKTVVIGTVLVGLSFSLQAASISNGGFEDEGALAPGGFRDNLTIGWTENPEANIFEVSTSFTTSGASGSNIGTLWSNAILSQAIGENVANNTPIQVSLSIGSRNDEAQSPPTNFSAGLFTTGGTALETITITDEPNVFDTKGVLSPVTFTFNPGVGHGQLGQAMELRIQATGGGVTQQLAVDDISVSVVPEPTTYALVSGLGLVGLAAYRRTRARKA